MSPRDQMLVLLGKISCTVNLSLHTCRSKKTAADNKEREHQRTTYMIEGNIVCRDTFKFLYKISQDRLTSILKWYKEHGLVPKEKNREVVSTRAEPINLKMCNARLHLSTTMLRIMLWCFQDGYLDLKKRTLSLCLRRKQKLKFTNFMLQL